MNIVLWILQGLLVAQFLFHGLLFLFPPPELLVVMKTTFSPGFRLSLGLAEVLAGIGLILPGMTRILPWLVSLAAAGVMVVTVSATVFHFARGEVSSGLTTAGLFVMAAFVAYMRWRVGPIRVCKTPQHVQADPSLRG